MTTLTKNSIANLSSRLWVLVSTYIFIPLFIAALGEEQYGLISFSTTIQAAINLLGLGLSGTLRREFARSGEADTEKANKLKLLRSTEFIFVAILLLISVACISFRRLIAENWLNYEVLSSETVALVVSLMIVSVSVQMLTNLWHGCLLGLDKQVSANLLYIGWSVARNVGGLIVARFSRSIVAFYVVYLFFDVLYAVVARIYLASRLVCENRERWHISDIACLKRILPYTGGLFVISLVSLISNQLDKVVVSKYMSLTDLGAYNTIITLGSLTRIFASAVAISAMTKFTQLFSDGKMEELEHLYVKMLKLTTNVTICLMAFIAVFAPDIVAIWIGKDVYVDAARACASYLVVGLGILGLQEIPYCYLLAKGNTKTNMILGIMTLPVFIAVSMYATKQYGLYGAAVSCFGIYLIQTLVYYFLVNRKIEKALIRIYLPIAGYAVSAFAIAFLCDKLCIDIDSHWLRVILGIIVGGLTLGTLLVISNFNMIGERIRKHRG